MNTLNEEQKIVADRVLNKKENVFISGSAGCGKSYLLKVLVNEFSKKYGNAKHVAVTAMTGIAANSLGGTTLHSFIGMGIDGEKKPNKYVLDRWCRTKVLFIDEVSMLTAEYFDKFYKFIILYDIQVICFGDFLQLPPVNGKFCFESKNWTKLKLDKNTVLLKIIIRQKNEEFANILNEIRVGNISDASLEYLAKLDVDNADEIKENATKIYAVNRNVYNENMRRLEDLETELKEFVATDTVTCNKERVPNFNMSKNPILVKMINKEAPNMIKLKVGAEVMLTRNRPPDYILVNGSRGTVVEIINGIPTVEFRLTNSDQTVTTEVGPIEYEASYQKYKVSRMQVPLMLAWSMTVHKCQGMTLKDVLFNTEGSFEKGQLYTGMSRATEPNGLVVDSIMDLIHLNKVSKKALAYYEKFG
jgi:ATP-dependent DNA helicase PIF1